MDEVYNHENVRGQRETVKIMKQGLAQNLQGGVTDPVFPMRYPDQIVPVWKPAYPDPRTGRKVGGHFIYIIDEESRWAQ